MFENMELDLDDAAFGEDDESWDEDDTEDDEGFGERASPRFRRTVPRINSQMQASRGVNSAVLRTPAGNAQLRLPQAVVSLEVFNKAIAGLRDAHNKLAVEVSANRDAIKKSSAQTTALAVSTKRAFAREKKRASQSNMMNMLMALMINKQTNRRIDEIGGAASTTSDSSMMMMLPMMMMGDSGGGGGDDSGMMMMVMMMGMMDR